VGIALYNVMGVAGDGSNYALKAILPKIVIGLIAVNFSFLAVKLMIDSVGVLTEAVYALPTNFITWDSYADDLELRLCRSSESSTAEGEKVKDLGPKKVKDASVLGMIFCEIENPEAAADDKVLSGLFSPTGETYFSHFGEHNATASIMINMGLTADADVVKLDEGGLDELAAMAIHALFGIFLFLMFGFAFVALVVVLIARLIILWICLALSPLIVLFFVFPDIANFGGGEMDLKDKFLKHLFVPLVIGVVLSIGFTMLNVLYDSESGQWTKQLGPNVEFGQLDTTSVDVAEMTTTLGKDITDFQDLLIAICAVLIIWIGVFAAADQTVASSVTSTIKGAGESVGKFIAKTPLYMTTIPVPGMGDEKGDMSLMSLMKLPKMKANARDNKSSEQARDVGKHIGMLEADLGDKFEDSKTKMRDATGGPAEAQVLQEYMMNKGADDNQGYIAKLLGESEGLGLNNPGWQEKIKEWKEDGTLASQLESGELHEHINGVSSGGLDPTEGDGWGTSDVSDGSASGSAGTDSGDSSTTSTTDVGTDLSTLNDEGHENMDDDEAAPVRQQIVSGLLTAGSDQEPTMQGAFSGINFEDENDQVRANLEATLTEARTGGRKSGEISTIINEAFDGMAIGGDGKISAAQYTERLKDAITAHPPKPATAEEAPGEGEPLVPPSPTPGGGEEEG